MSLPTALIIGPGAAFGELLYKELAKTHEVHTASRTSPTFSAHHHTLDLLDTAAKEALHSLLADISPDIVIFSTKYSPKGGLSLSESDFFDAFSVNVYPLLTILRSLKEIPSSGRKHCIAIGGGYKDAPHPNKLALSASKGALHTMVLTLQKECQEHALLLHELIIDGWVHPEAEKLTPQAILLSVCSLLQEKTPTIRILTEA